MAPASTESHHHHHVRRDSSPREANSSRRRPRLMRASATEPSITTTNATKGATSCSPNSNRRATEILSRVQVAVSNNGSAGASVASPTSMRTYDLDGHYLSDGVREELLMNKNPYSACYFSFPSFDAWEGEQQDDEKSMSPT